MENTLVAVAAFHLLKEMIDKYMLLFYALEPDPIESNTDALFEELSSYSSMPFPIYYYVSSKIDDFYKQLDEISSDFMI